MQRRPFGIVRSAAAATLGVAIVLCGCGTQTIVKTVTTTKPAPSTSTPTSTSSSSASQRARIGDTLTLAGTDGESLAVTVNQVVDPLQTGEFDTPDPGTRFVGIQITLRNVGSKAYSDSPSNGATLLSTTDEQADTALVTSGPCGNEFQSSVKIAPGDTQRGCLPFQLSKSQRPGTFQFTLNSGFADQTGQWSVAGASRSVATAPAASSSGAATSPSASAKTSCGERVSVGPNTSCPFASNVRSKYDAQGPGTYVVPSPTTGQSYPMTCTNNAGAVTCIGGNNASVYFTP